MGGGMEHRYHPITDARFDDAMHQISNRSLGFSCDADELLDAVAERRKPMAEVSLDRSDWARDLVRRASGRACLARCTERRLHGGLSYHSVVLAVPGQIGTMFDLPALASDYAQYLSPAQPAVREPALAAIDAELARLAPLSTGDLLDFLDCIEALDMVWGGDGAAHIEKCSRAAASYVRCGLLLGYPPATTAAMILSFLVGHPYGYR
jgi:hypothetical protein